MLDSNGASFPQLRNEISLNKEPGRYTGELDGLLYWPLTNILNRN